MRQCILVPTFPTFCFRLVDDEFLITYDKGTDALEALTLDGASVSFVSA